MGADTESHSLVKAQWVQTLKVKAVHEVLPYILHFSTIWIKLGVEIFTKTYLVTVNFVTNVTVKGHAMA
jgi:hypothetical protein